MQSECFQVHAPDPLTVNSCSTNMVPPGAIHGCAEGVAQKSGQAGGPYGIYATVDLWRDYDKILVQQDQDTGWIELPVR